MNLFELFVKIGVDDQASDSISSLTSKLGSGLTTAATVATAAIGAAATAVAAFGKIAISASAEYETAFAQVQTIMDSSVVSTDEMSSAILDLSSKMGIASSELSETVYNAISATGDTANAVALAGQASQLATAGFTDTSSALSVLTTAMNAYGLSADEVAGISDSLIMVQNLGVTTVSELSASMGRAIASASAYGVDLTNLESAYVSMTKAGINTAESTTYISSMLKELGDSGTDVSEIIEEKTGKSFDQLMASGASLGDVLGILYDAVDGDSTALMNLWSSAEAGKASSAIISQGLDQFNENLIAIEESAGATETAYETMADTLEHKISVLKTTFTNFVSSIGGELTPAISSFVEGVTDLLNGDMDAGINKIEAGIEGLLDTAEYVMPKLMEIGSGIIGSFGGAIIESLPLLLECGAEIISELLVGIAGSLPELATSAIPILGQLVISIADNLPMLLEAALGTVMALANGIAESLPELIPAAADIMMQIVNTLTNPDTLSNLVDAALAIILALSNGLIDEIPNLLETAPVIIGNLVQAIIDSVPQIIFAAGELVFGLIEGLTGPDNTEALLNGTIEMLGSIIIGIASYYKQMFEKGGEIFTNIKEGFMQFINDPIQWGKDLIDNFISGITQKWENLKNTVANVAQSVADFLGFSEPKKGPLSNFHTYAPDMMDLFIKGIRDNEKKLTDQIEKTFDFGERTITAGISYSSYGDGGFSNGSGYGTSQVSVIQNIYSEAKTAADLMQEALYQQERAVLLGV